MEKIAAGDEDAYRKVFLFYRHRLFTVILGMVGDVDRANDIYQEVFLRVWLKREMLMEVENFAGWLFAIARNLILDALKQTENIKPNGLDIILGNQHDPSDSPADILQNKEIRETLSAAIGQLSERQRETYNLIKVAGMSRSEAAAKMNVSPETIKWYLEQAMRNIRLYCSKYLYFLVFLVVAIYFY